MRYVGLFFGSLLVIGCGENRTPEPEPAPAASSPARPAPPDPRSVIACFGNSLTAGFGVDPSQSYPAVLQQMLNREGIAYRVMELGVSGDTTTDGLARLDTVLAARPAIVVLEFGGNDGLRGLPVATTRANLEQMIVALQKARVQVVLAGMTLPPNYGPEYVSSFTGVYPDLARQYRLKLIPFLLEGVGGSAVLMQRDGLHPTAKGYARVAHNVLESLRPLLKRERGSGH